MQRLDDAPDHARLIDARKAHVDVEHVGALLLLADALVDDVVEVVLAQRRLKALLAGGVDALADDGDAAASQRQLYQALGAGDGERGRGGPTDGCATCDDAAKQLDVGGVGAAASSDDAHAVFHHKRHGVRIGNGIDIEDGPPVLHARKAGVGLDHHGFAGDGEHGLGEGSKLRRAKRAVDTQDICPQGIEGDGGDIGRGAKEGPAVRFERHGGEDGQVAVLFRGEDRGLDLCQVGHGLDDDEVATCCLRRTDLLGEVAVRLVERHGPQRAKQGPQRADVSGDIAGAGRTRAAHRSGEDVLDRCRTVELEGVGAKGVGGDDLAAGGDVGRVDLGDGVRVGEAEQFGEGTCFETGRLEHGSHASIEQQVTTAFENGAQVLVRDTQRIQGAGRVCVGAVGDGHGGPNVMAPGRAVRARRGQARCR